MPHAVPVDELLTRFETVPEGLPPNEAAERLRRYGPNRVIADRGVPVGRILASQFGGAIFWLLAAAAGLSFALGEIAEALAIVIVLLVNGAIGFFTELRAVKSMAALRKLTRTQTTVRRGGQDHRIDAAGLVPGDVVVLAAGEVVPADLRLIRADDLHADESLLTGESVPVAKSAEPVPSDAPMAERRSMAFRGTSLTRGAGLALVTATGAKTELAAIAAMVEEAEDERSPLEVRLDRLGNVIAIGAIIGILTLALAGIAAGRELVPTVKTAIALAVAAVPEGLPIVATLALARGMWRMAARNALINRLAAVETLGSTNLLMTDKTGTLTENRMSVARVLTPGGDYAPDDPDPAVRRVLETAALCTEVGQGDEGPIGDPMEIALVRAAGPLPAAPPAGTRPFDPDLKMMATIHEAENGRFAAVKGAPEAVLARAVRLLGPDGEAALEPRDRARLARITEAAAGEGLRLLGVARGPAEPDPYGALTLLGFVGLIDPPRPDAAEAIAELHRAGIRVVMVTGDHPATARAIARRVGLTDREDAPVCNAAALRRMPDQAMQELAACDVFARFEPRSKLDLVRRYRREGAVVAMTGDGVNDAPALKEADIGVAMGGRGTQVAAEAADVILRDDRLGSIAAAVREGRIVYGNIQLFVRYLFSCNLSEILLIGAAIAAGLPMPLLPLQILFLNLVTDVFPAIALGAGEGPKGVVDQAPRARAEPLVTARAWRTIAWQGALLTLAVLAVFLLVLATPARTLAEANTAAFLTIGLAQLWHVFAMHGAEETVFASQVTRNPTVWGAVALSAGLLALAVLLPPLAQAMTLVVLDLSTLTFVLIASLAPLVVIETAGLVRRAAWTQTSPSIC